VRLTEDDVKTIAAFKGMSEFDFIQAWTRLAANRVGLALLDKPNGECIFLEGNDCAIQAVKPAQCQGFPNVWNFPGFENVCEAVPREVSEEEHRMLMDGVKGKKVV
jgi:Fe-S-cluster containining protein